MAAAAAAGVHLRCTALEATRAPAPEAGGSPHCSAGVRLSDADIELDAFMMQHEGVLTAADSVRALRRAGGELVEAFRGNQERLTREMIWLCRAVVRACGGHDPRRAHELGLLDAVVTETRARAAQGRLVHRLAAQARARAKLLSRSQLPHDLAGSQQRGQSGGGENQHGICWLRSLRPNLSHVDTPNSDNGSSYRPDGAADEKDLRRVQVATWAGNQEAETAVREVQRSTTLPVLIGHGNTHQVPRAQGSRKADSFAPETPPTAATPISIAAVSAAGTHEAPTCTQHAGSGQVSPSPHLTPQTPPYFFANFMEHPDLARLELSAQSPRCFVCTPQDSSSDQTGNATPSAVRMEEVRHNGMARQPEPPGWSVVPQAKGAPRLFPFKNADTRCRYQLQIADGPFFEIPSADITSSADVHDAHTDSLTRGTFGVVGALSEMATKHTLSFLWRAGLGLIVVVLVFWAARKYARMKSELQRLTKMAADDRMRIQALRGLLARRLTESSQAAADWI